MKPLLASLLVLSGTTLCSHAVVTMAFAQGAITAASDVSTAGTLLYAYDLGPTADTATRPFSTNNPVVNGVTFTTTSTTPTVATGSNGNLSWTTSGGTFGNATPNYAEGLTTSIIPQPEYLSLLTDGFSIAGTTGASATLTLGGLTAGKEYLVQFWFNDSRTASAGRTTTLRNLNDGNSGNTNFITVPRNAGSTEDYLGTWVTATFTAETNSAAFLLTGGNFVGVNALQVREVPEPGAALLGLISLPALLRRRRKRD